MIRRVQVLKWVLDIDYEATTATYEKLPRVWPSCMCLYCQNFNAACNMLPKEFVRLCFSLGIDPTKAAEVYEMGRGQEEQTRFYGGWYHVVGRIVLRPGKKRTLYNRVWRQIIRRVTGNHCPEPSVESGYRTASGFRVSFTEVAHMVPDDFPRPVLQLDFSGDIPWILEERPEL